MKAKVITAGTLAVALVLSTVAPVLAQTPEEKKDADMTAMMAKMEEFRTPGKPHEGLQKLVGKWSGTAKFWMDPSAPPTEGTGTAEFKTIFGGRYLVQDFTGTLMGQEFHGMGITAYDNFRQEYVEIWLDDMGTGIFVSRGSANDDGSVITFTGPMDDPMTGRKDVPTRSVLTIVDPDTQRTEMFVQAPDGTEYKSMDILYTRVK
jgi:hypothetical protein